MWRVFLLLLPWAASISAFVASPRAPASAFSRKLSLAATPADAIATLDASQTNSLNKIASAIPDLAPKPDFTWVPGGGATIAGAAAKLDARDAPGPANVAWISSLCVDAKLSSMTIFNGPLTNVPHVFSQCAVVGDSSLVLTMDLRPRAYGAYEKRDANGNYPGPDELGRQAFEFSGNRMEFDKNFGTTEVVELFSSLATSLEGASPAPESPSELDLLVRGPLYLSLTMPLTDGNVATIAAAREKLVDYWLGWSQDPAFEHRPGAPINSQYVYDTKYKQNAYTSLLGSYEKLFGPEGASLAAADSGPLDEAYVGGGS